MKKTYRLNIIDHKLIIDDVEYDVGSIELRTIYLFFSRVDQLITIQEIANLKTTPTSDNGVRVRIGNIKRKFGLDIINEINLGYMLKSDENILHIIDLGL